MYIYLALAIALADDCHGAQLGIRLEVAGIGNGIEEGHTVIIHREGAGMAHSAQHCVAEVEKLERHLRVLDVVAFYYLVLDHFGHLAHAKSLDMQSAQDGEVDVAVHIHTITFGPPLLGAA